jgi:hypothetical protein
VKDDAEYHGTYWLIILLKAIQEEFEGVEIDNNTPMSVLTISCHAIQTTDAKVSSSLGE